MQCQCEHADHFEAHTQRGQGVHGYLEVPAGERTARFVGRICDTCADGHMAPWVGVDD